MAEWNIPFFLNPILGVSFLLIAYVVSCSTLKKASRVFLTISMFLSAGLVFIAMPFLFVLAHRYSQKRFFYHDMDAPIIIAFGIVVIGVYLYIRSRYASRTQLLEDNRKYQLALWKAALSMVRVKDLSRLLGLIVRVVLRSVRVENCSIYVYHEKAQRYVLKASGGSKQVDVTPVSSIPEGAALVEYMQRLRRPVLYEEVISLVDGSADEVVGSIATVMDKMSAAVVLPGFIDDRLAIFIVLGEKRSGKLFTSDELMAFSMLCNHAALVIENVRLREDIKSMQERLFKAEKMAVLGTIADGVSHQINNRLHSIGFIAGDAIDTIKMGRKGSGMANNIGMDELCAELEYALNRIQVNVKQGGEVLVGLLEYSRNGSNGFSSVDLNKVLDASIEMAQFKIMDNVLDFVRKFGRDIPKLKANFTQLQEVFFNIIDNSYEAIIQRKKEFNDSQYRGRVEFSFFEKDGMGHIIITDNGIGVRDSDIHKLFDPFYSTKAEQGKGTGLGLYIIKKIIEDNHNGKVIFRSEYGKGSQVEVVLPVVS